MFVCISSRLTLCWHAFASIYCIYQCNLKIEHCISNMIARVERISIQNHIETSVVIKNVSHSLTTLNIFLKVKFKIIHVIVKYSIQKTFFFLFYSRSSRALCFIWRFYSLECLNKWKKINQLIDILQVYDIKLLSLLNYLCKLNWLQFQFECMSANNLSTSLIVYVVYYSQNTSRRRSKSTEKYIQKRRRKERNCFFVAHRA